MNAEINQKRQLTPEVIYKAKKIKFTIAFFLNLAIFIFAIVGMMWAYARFYGQGVWFWGWYTYLAIILLGDTALLYVIFAFIMLAKHKHEVPVFVSIFKNIGTAVAIITFVITVCTFLIGSKDGGKWHPKYSVFEKSNFILHIICPILAILSNFTCERTLKMKFVHNCYGMITSLIYSGHYLAVGYTHLNPDGTVMPGPEGDSDRYDRYGIFKILGPKGAWLLIFLLSGLTFLVCWLCWLANRKICIYDEKAPIIFSKKKKQEVVDTTSVDASHIA